MNNLEQLKNLVFAADNHACFIERERILNRLEKEFANYKKSDKYARILAALLAEVSTPVLACDYFAGRMVEALPDEGMCAPSRLLQTMGHTSLHYEKLLRLGFRGILEEVEESAARLGDEESALFAENCRIVVEAVRDYANRYAAQARAAGHERMAKALETVPYLPAYDFYSALQSVWLVHMIGSCYIGGRDFAFGRFDQYMLPYYEQALAAGESKEALTELLAGFFMKANEICGRTAHDYAQKPILSHSSNQYINLGGENPNAFSCMVLDAAVLSNMAQPHMNVLLKPDADKAFTAKVFEAFSLLTDKLHIYNYDVVVKSLLDMGIEDAVARDFSYSACCTFDLNYRASRRECYVPVPQIFVQTLHSREFSGMDELIAAFTEALRIYLQEYMDAEQLPQEQDEALRHFSMTAMLLSDCTQRCRYPNDGNSPYNVVNLFCPGVATIGDSLMVLDKLVFTGKEMGYREFMDILDKDYVNHEALRQRILNMDRFGNDTENDRYAVMAANAFLDAVDKLVTRDNFYPIPGLYSLNNENVWKEETGATPDGRRRGDPFSENQSPTYGADKQGITALLGSVAKLPFHRAPGGGLNLTFSNKVDPQILRALAVSYFEMGGLHIGISVNDRATLLDAMEHPEKHQALTVRLYGFSEYFVSLAEWQQLALLHRTEYCV